MKRFIFPLLMLMAFNLVKAQNVGIQTNSPGYPLDVNGRIRIRHNNGNTAGVWLNRANNTEASFVGQMNDTTYGIWDAPANTWRYAFNHSNGFMGIGTTTPKYPLAFASSIGDKISLWGGSTSATTNHYGMGIQGSLMQFFTPSGGDDIAFGIGRSGNFTENMRIKGNGFVGIGTVNPTYPLTVMGNSNGIVTKNGAVEVGTYVSSTSAYIQTYSNHDLDFATNNASAQMTLSTAGNLGIGTSSPTARLSVNGNVRIADGTQGSGKVLTSDASGNASWKGSSYTNSERFMIGFTSSGSSITYSVLYNTSGNISINASNGLITINKTGLYHFEANNTGTVQGSGDISPSSANPEYSYLRLNIASLDEILLASVSPYYKSVLPIVGTRYSSFSKGSADIYLTAGTQMLLVFPTSSAGTLSNDGHFSAYLIAE